MTEILHVVLVDWDGEDGTAPERASALVAEHLPTIDGVVSVASGPSVSPEGLEGGFDWALVVRFRDAAARDAYLPHPAHQPVADHIGARSARVVVFDVTG
ncbi:Dabb family protein [Curtobacterium sp. MCPF17_047]|uniref:Dabb family protein n=1 Tax=unclassified Curtobacterium TaxID=257496 RepID=UPI000DA91D02|nr:MULTISPECIES: Dabb family protein [unclassified Curtobacterium]PZE62824.1 Dabb family protein [Curtobacterium sp. MCPF17_001]PZF65610.1 Dabb family protein [Curtobacterium sp. MCPF17_047]WIB11513.1 Dabb family protein [Curtobacterium sp. MCPF17_052]